MHTEHGKATRTIVCIYCLMEKPRSAFNQEHVLPQAFDKFEGGIVLHCVCKDCNQQFGDSIDRKLARDSIEGFARYRLGGKDPASFKSEGLKSTTHAVLQDGPAAGALAFVRPAADPARPYATVGPQIGFAVSEEGPFEYFPATGLPTVEELLARGFVRGEPVMIRTWGLSYEETIDALTERGMTYLRDGSRVEPLPAVGPVSFRFVVGPPEMRAIAKIAFGAVARRGEGALVRMPLFDDVRRYTRDGRRGDDAFVQPQSRRQLRTRAAFDDLQHEVDVMSSDTCVAARVSFFGEAGYLVRLTRGPLPFGNRFVDSWRYNVATRRATMTRGPV